MTDLLALLRLKERGRGEEEVKGQGDLVPEER